MRRANPGQIDFLRVGKGMAYVMRIADEPRSRPRLHLRIQGAANRILRGLLPTTYRIPLRWDSYQKADAVLASTSWESWIMQTLFQPPAENLHVVPTGVDDAFFAAGALRDRHGVASGGDRLVSVATITRRKRVCELARAAILGGVPLTVVGKPYTDSDPYHHDFLRIVEESRGLVTWEGSLTEPDRLASLLALARGFVLVSSMETQSTAALAAAAAGCPLLLTDLPWAKATFGAAAKYCRYRDEVQLAESLKQFYKVAPELPRMPQPASWSDVAGQLVDIYRRVQQSPGRRGATPAMS